MNVGGSGCGLFQETIPAFTSSIVVGSNRAPEVYKPEWLLPEWNCSPANG